MYKVFSIVMFIVFSNSVYSEEIPPSHMWVISDVADSTVQDGWCRIKGVVYDYETSDPVQGAYVSEVRNELKMYTDLMGRFDFFVRDTDSIIYAFHAYYGEIVGDPYDFKSGHCVNLDFVFLDDHSYDKGIIHEVEKPVIYMYSDLSLEVNVELKQLGELKFTYPKYVDGWEVSLSDKGIYVDGMYYPYLFWDAEMYLDFIVNEDGSVDGAFVDTDSIVSYLEAELSMLGLNQVEKTDFITYWAPRIQQEDYATIQFLIDEDYTKCIGDMKITPAPDKIRRVYLLFEGQELPVSRRKMTTQKYSGFERDGFVVLEWGGSQIGSSDQLSF